MPQATLKTSRLTLVPLGDEHLEDEIALDADPEVMQFLFDGSARTRAQVVEAHPRRLAAARDGLGVWAGLVDGVFTGWWCLDSDVGPGQAELGYRLHSRFWRQGLASEGSRELLRHAFEDLGLERVLAQTMAVNVASRATMAKVGLTYVRTFHEKYETPIPGWEHGEVEYAVSRDDWLARQAR